jgi:site-specific DNA-methyltransferase (adenine-specific)
VIPEFSIRLDWSDRNASLLPESAVLREVRPGDARATLITGDNLVALRALRPRLASKVTLAYLDPPFLTGRAHARVTRERDPGTGLILRRKTAAFDDRWESLEQYLGALAPRLSAARDLLAPHGCLVLHVDSKTSHYAKVLCDHIFGARAFASEIVWRYRRWPSKTPNFQRVHDVLLRYVRDPDTKPRFRQLYEPLAPSTRATWGDTRQRAVVGADGRRARSSKTEEATPGTPLGDVWEIGIVAPVARERTGYPTQKPETLLARLIEACTDAEDLILDPYLGSGPTAAVALRLGRRVVGIDANPAAIAITGERVRASGVAPRCEELAPGPVRAVGPRRRSARTAA